MAVDNRMELRRILRQFPNACANRLIGSDVCRTIGLTVGSSLFERQQATVVDHYPTTVAPRTFTPAHWNDVDAYISSDKLGFCRCDSSSRNRLKQVTAA